MRQEEAELRLKKFHSKMFAKHAKSNSLTVNDREFDAFNVFEKLSKESKSHSPVRLSDVILIHLKGNISGNTQLTLSL